MSSMCSDGTYRSVNIPGYSLYADDKGDEYFERDDVIVMLQQRQRLSLEDKTDYSDKNEDPQNLTIIESRYKSSHDVRTGALLILVSIFYLALIK